MNLSFCWGIILKTSFLFGFAGLIGLGAVNSAMAVEQIQIADDSEHRSVTDSSQSVRAPSGEKGVSLTGGLGAVYMPTLNLQSEFHLGPKTSAVLGVQGIYGGFYATGAASLAARHYLTGDSSKGWYIEEGIHGGVGAMAFIGGMYGVGPNLGFGGKYETRKGLTIDINAGVTALVDFQQDAPVLPLPTASITFGKRLRAR